MPLRQQPEQFPVGGGEAVVVGGGRILQRGATGPDKFEQRLDGGDHTLSPQRWISIGTNGGGIAGAPTAVHGV
ncbi:hypothetical protein [Micromonospora sp. NPDC005806]|uniref:hypothetical protein n=1 Tax=Micromonospora sp. NPDC005806 TaxID=3364234 RepID=UPI0036930745